MDRESMVLPVGLQCELSDNPLWIDIPHPRFSWRLSEHVPADWFQVACRIQVYSDDDSLYWDSGQRDESRPCGFPYQGKPLASCSVYRWRVCLKDSKLSWSEWSALATFETALSKPEDFLARWISTPEPCWYSAGQWQSGVPNQATEKAKGLHAKGIYLTTRVALDYPRKSIERSRAYVTGVGTYQLYVDGRQVGRSLLSPAQTDFHKRVYYDVVPLEEYVLPDCASHDKTDMEVALFLGNGRHIALYGFGKPRGCVQILIDYHNGHRQWILSDENWSVADGPIQENCLFNGEVYDSRVALGRGKLSAVEVVEGYPLHAAAMPPIVIDARIPASRMWLTPQGYLYDFGQNFSGFVELRTIQPSGTSITLRFAENITNEGLLNPASNRQAEAMDTCICNGRLVVWHPVSTYHGFRYVLLSGYRGVPSLDTVTGLFIHTRTQSAADFVCSDESIQKVHTAILWGIRSNMMGIPTDSPQRDERQGWLGDAHLAAPVALLNYETQLFYEKFLQDIADTQNPDGSITDVAPKFWMDKSADPAWGSAFITIAWYLYWYRGDQAILEKRYAELKRYIQYLLSQASNGIIEDLGTFGDWCAPGLVASKKTGLPYISTWYLHHDLGLMEKIAYVLGEVSDADRYHSQALLTRDALIDRYWKGSHMESLPTTPWDFPDQTSQALALAGDFFEESVSAALAEVLEHLVSDTSGDHVGTGIHGTRYLLEQLSRWGYWEKAFAIATQRSYPSWAYMLGEGATTLWERWELITNGGMCSHNHVMLGTIDQWYYHFVVGIFPLAAGWQEIGLAPARFKLLDWAGASITTPYGETQLRWRREHDTVTMTIGIPNGTVGQLFLPEDHPLVEACVASEPRPVLFTTDDHPNRPYPLEHHGYLTIPAGLHELTWKRSGAALA